MLPSLLFSAILLLFAPFAMGAVQSWAVGIIFLLVLAAGIGCLLQKNSLHIEINPLNKPIVTLLTLTLYSLFFSTTPHFSKIIAAALLFAYLFFYWIILQFSKERFLLFFLLYWIIGISTLLCLAGLAMRSGTHPLPWLDDLGLPTSPQHWLTATFGNHNHMAGWLEMSVPLLLCLILFGCQRTLLPVQVPLLILQSTCLFLTYSRGGWAGAAAAAAVIAGWLLAEGGWSRRQTLLLFFAALAIGGTLLLSSSDFVQRLLEADAEDRTLIWRGTVRMILAHWRTGTGPGTYPVAFAQFQPPGFSSRYDMAHNDYLQFTAEMGLGLPVLIIWMGIVLYRYGLRKMKSPSRLERAATLGSLAGITAILVHSVSDFNLHIPANALLFATLAAFVARHEK